MKANKMLFTSLAIVLCVILALAIYHVAELTPAYADQYVDVVSLTVDAPINGGDPSSSRITWDGDEYFVKNRNWYDITADKDLVDKDDRFIGGHDYRLFVVVEIYGKLYPATKFLTSGLGNPDVNVTVNGETAIAKKYYGQDATHLFTVVFDFTNVDYEQIHTVKIANLDAPTSNAKPDYEGTIVQGGCQPNTMMGLKNGITWYDPSINSLVGENQVFENGKTYELQYSLKVNEGFTFLSPMEVYLNGEILSDDDYSFINEYLTITKSYVCENAKITTVDINDVEAPEWGSTPVFNANALGNYSLIADEDQVSPDPEMKNGVKWIKVDDGAELTDSTEFDANEIYKAVFYLQADEYFDFAMNGGLSAVQAKVNGKLAECYPIYAYGGDYAKYLAVEYTFAPTGNTISDVYVSGLILPENTDSTNGQDAESITLGAGYTVDYVRWYDENDEPFEGEFEYGNAYSTILTFYADDGFVFADSPTLYIDGEKITPNEQWKNFANHVSFRLSFDCRPKTITEIALSFNEPVTGEPVLTDIDSSNIGVNSTLEWYADENLDDDPDYDGEPVTEGNFNEGIYGAKITLIIKEGFIFSNTVKVRLNNFSIYTDSLLFGTCLSIKEEYKSEPLYTITFDANGGYGEMEPIEGLRDQSLVVLPECTFEPNTDVDGKYLVFGGWCESSIGAPVELNANGQYQMPPNDVILYALWDEHVHTYVNDQNDPAYWTFDERGHWRECTDVDCPDDVHGELDFAYHDYDNHVCTICGAPEKTYTLSFACYRDYVTGEQASISGIYYGETVTMPACTFTYDADKYAFNRWQIYINDEYRFLAEGDQIQYDYLRNYTAIALFTTLTTVTIDMGGRYDDVVYNGQSDQLYNLVYKAFDGKNMFEKDKDYIIGFSDAPIDYSLAPNVIIESLIPLYTTITEDVTIYSYWATLHDPVYTAVLPFDRVVNADEDSHELGQFYFSDLPIPSDVSFLPYFNIVVSVSTNGLINQNDPSNVIPLEIYDKKIDGYRITIGDNSFMVIENLNNEYDFDSISTIAGNREYVYIDGYGSQEEFSALADIVKGKVVVCNRGEITFSQKATNAANAKALALIVVNYVDDILDLGLDSYMQSMPVVSAKHLTVDYFKSNGQKNESEGIEYYVGNLTIDDKTTSEYYFNGDFNYYADNFLDYLIYDRYNLNVWYKIADISKLQNNAKYIGSIDFTVTLYDENDDMIGESKKSTKLTIDGDHAHSLQQVKAVPATCESAGVKEYYTCVGCGKYFEDADGNIEIQDIDAWKQDQGKIDLLDHVLGEWQSDENDHWKVCSVCQKEISRSAHVDEDQNGICDVCDRAFVSQPEDPNVDPNPEYPHSTVDGVEVFEQTLTIGTKSTVIEIFTSAKALNGVVKIKVEEMTFTFDQKAVAQIGGKDVTLSANLITSDFDVQGFDEICLVIEVSLEGSTFENGNVKITLDKEIEIPDGKELKVYYVNGENKTEMNCVYEKGVLSFDTNHFSSFAAVLESVELTGEKKGLSGGAIAGIVIGAVVLVGGIAVLCFFLLRKKKK